MLKEKPIIFNMAMVKAIIADNKTQTRRVAKNIINKGLCKYKQDKCFLKEKKHEENRNNK